MRFLSAYVRQRTEETPAGAYHLILRRAAELYGSVCRSRVIAAQAGIRPPAIEVRVLLFRLGDAGFVVQFDNSQ